MKEKIYKRNAGFRIKEVDEENHIIRGVFSTGGEDRHGEIIDQNEWILESFLENPVILLFHDHHSLPVAKAIELGVDRNGNLAGAIQFAAKEYEVADTVFKLYANGFMRAFSVGFRSGEVVFEPEEDKVILRQNELHEISCVNVPANAGALAYAKGIDMEPLERMRKGPSPENKDHATMDHEKGSEEESSKPDMSTLEKAIRTLTDVLERSDTARRAKGGGKVDVHAAKSNTHAVGKKIPVRTINRAMRALLKIKKMK